MNRPVACLAVAALTLGACANEMVDPDDPRLANARLEIVGTSAINLGYDATADLTVRYVTEEGSPISSAALDFAIVGEPGGSRLGALQTITDADGMAQMVLTASDTEAMFEVSVTPPSGDPVTYDVAVSDTPLGSLVVTMTYVGSRDLVAFDALLFEGEDCDTLDPTALPFPLRSAATVGELTARPGFAGLTPADDYTVVVTARNAAALAAFGCRDAVVVTRGAETEVNITLSDVEIPATFVGVWDLDNRFDFGGAAPPSVQVFLDVLSEIADDDVTDSFGDPTFELDDDDFDGIAPEYGVDPGAFVTDMAMRQTCRSECVGSEEYADCSQLDHAMGDLHHIYEESFTTWSGAQSLFRGGCGAWEFILADVQNLVNNAVFAVLPDFAADWAQLASDLARAITNAHILSELTINAPGAGNEFEVPITHELVEMVVAYRNPLATPAGSAESASFLLADAGFTSLTIDDVSTVDGDTLNIPEHSFDMSWGELVLYIYRNVLLSRIFGVTSTGALLASWVSCPTLASWLDTAVADAIWPIPSPVDATDLEGYCNAAMSAVGGLLDDELAGRLDVDGTLTIAGSAVAEEVDYDSGQVDSLVDGVWAGTFSEDAMSAPITGTFTGARRTE